MKLPNAENAFIDLRKLRDYALSSQHRIGRHKARLFASLLNMNTNDAEALRNILLRIIKTNAAEIGIRDEHGQRYRVDFTLNWHDREATIRSAWNICPDEDFPRLVTCYPLEEVSK
jgi:Domain of unknown function (DUF6883)